MAGRIRLGKTVFAASIDRLRSVYGNGDTVVVSFSGGKDSGVMLELAVIAATLEGRLPVNAIYRDEEAMFPGTEDYALRVAARPEVKLHWVYAHQALINIYNRRDPYWWPFDPLLPPDKWMRQPPDFAYNIPQLNIEGMVTAERFPPGENGRLTNLIGLRTQESSRRMLGLHSTGGWISIRPSPWGAIGGRPIYDWADGDIWHAISKFCNPAEAPIWMGDFSFRPLGEVHDGDEVIGWVEGTGVRPKLVKTKVLRKFRYEDADLVRVTMASGRSVTCTPDHVWRQVRWTGHKLYGPAAIGAKLVHVVDLWERNGHEPATLGWLAGIYDGEGSYDRIYQHPERNPAVYGAIERALVATGLTYVRLNDSGPAQHGFRLTGGRQTYSRFLAEAGPVRSSMLEAMVLGHRIGSPDEIITIEPAGRAPVFGLETETGNYVAWGYASANSWDYNRAYDVMHKLGMSRHELRIAPPTQSAAGLKSLGLAAKAWPDWFDRLAERCPGVEQGAMFGRRWIEPYHKLGETWRDTFERECILDAPPWIANRSRIVAERFMDRHAAHSAKPFPEVEPCHDCAGGSTSWKGLAHKMYGGDPFSVTFNFLDYMEPSFFRPEWKGTRLGEWGYQGHKKVRPGG